MLEKIKNIHPWVKEEDINTKERQRREVIHILLSAISNSDFLKAKMAMKGGVLLAIKYGSPRYTIDVDFSTSMKLADINIEAFKNELNKKLLFSSEKSNYDLTCTIQKIKQKPNDPTATWPTFQVTLGYAYKSDANSFRRLQRGNSSDIIKIDYSFNEMIFETEELELSDGEIVFTYSYVDLLSEKYRAILQQEQRKRNRAQDVYDIYYILKNFEMPDEALKKDILEALIKKSTSRKLHVNKSSISDPDIIKRSEVKYKTLEHTIYGELPPFKMAYSFIQAFYEGLPWDQVTVSA